MSAARSELGAAELSLELPAKAAAEGRPPEQEGGAGVTAAAEGRPPEAEPLREAGLSDPFALWAYAANMSPRGGAACAARRIAQRAGLDAQSPEALAACTTAALLASTARKLEPDMLAALLRAAIARQFCGESKPAEFAALLKSVERLPAWVLSADGAAPATRGAPDDLLESDQPLGELLAETRELLELIERQLEEERTDASPVWEDE